MQRPKKNKQAGEAFKKLLEEKNFSQYKLVQVTGLDQGLISRLANGYTASPKPATLEKIAEALEVDLGELTKIFTQSPVRSHSAEVSQSQEPVAAETPSKNTDFVGREEALNDLDNLVNEGAKVILIQAEGGVGKTTLAQKWFDHQGLEPLLLRVGMTPQNIQSAEDWVRHKLLNDFQESPERNFLTMLEQLRVKLQTQRIGVLIDNLEPALINGDFIEPHQSYYVELLTVLAHPTVRSITLVTSRESLHEPGITGGFQTFHTYLLEGLKKKVWEKHFDSQNISINIKALSEMHRAYGGNAFAMHLLSSDIRKQSQGNLEVYWQHNRDDLLKLRSLKSLVKRQFNKLKEDNLQAYDLLCRLGFYPERDVPFVPNAWLRCLLWDVPEKNRQQIIDDLCDRYLVKVCDDGYYLHPVIRAESVERLKSLDESRSNYLCLIKEQVDLMVAREPKIQNSLTWISQKFNLVSEIHKKAAFRAFYLGVICENNLDKILESLDDEYKYWELTYSLESNLAKLCGKPMNQIAKILGFHTRTEIIQALKPLFSNQLEQDYLQGFEDFYIKLIEDHFYNYHQFYLELLSQGEMDWKTAGFVAELTFNLSYSEEELKIIKECRNINSLYMSVIQDISQTFMKGYNKVFNKYSWIEQFKEYTINLSEYFRNHIKLIFERKPDLVEETQEIYKISLPNEAQESPLEHVKVGFLIKNCNHCLELQFSDEQKKLLKQYYEVNLLLMYCLDSASEEVRSYIEDTLLLPIDESKEWSPGN